MFKIAGIGSIQTPNEICAAMFKIGTWCAIQKIEVRSGHANGADWAFENGAGELCIAYLPWVGFNSQLKMCGNAIILDFTKEVMELAEKYHPSFNYLSPGAKKLIARNSFQVLGSDLKSPVNAIVCWTKDAKTVGGTGQALRIAEDYGLPVINMAMEEFNTADKVIEILKALMTSHSVFDAGV